MNYYIFKTADLKKKKELNHFNIYCVKLIYYYFFGLLYLFTKETTLTVKSMQDNKETYKKTFLDTRIQLGLRIANMLKLVAAPNKRIVFEMSFHSAKNFEAKHTLDGQVYDSVDTTNYD